MQTSYADLFKRTFIVVAVAILPVLIWYLFGVILIAFGAILLAMLLRLGAAPFMRWLKLREGVALLISGLLMAILLGGAGFLFETRIAGQMRDVLERAGAAAANIEASLKASEFGKLALTHLAGSSFSLADILSRFLQLGSTFLESLIILVIGGIYLAAQPRLYRDGLIQLFPPRAHARVAEIIDDLANALRLWLIGQLIQMVVIGTLAMLAVWIIGVPSPIALGLIAAIGEFVPYLGPIVAAVPAVLVAMTKSTETALWTALAYLIIQQAEGHLLLPLIQRHLVYIPPALILLGIVAITYLFGPVSAVFAAPMAVVIFVAVKVAYVRDTLGEQTKIPGETR